MNRYTESVKTVLAAAQLVLLSLVGMAIVLSIYSLGAWGKFDSPCLLCNMGMVSVRLSRRFRENVWEDS